MVDYEVPWILFCCVCPVFKFVGCIKRVILGNSCYYIWNALVYLKLFIYFHSCIVRNHCFCHITNVASSSNIDINASFDFGKFDFDISAFKVVQRIWHFVITNIIRWNFIKLILVPESLMSECTLFILYSYGIIFIRILDSTSCSIYQWTICVIFKTWLFLALWRTGILFWWLTCWNATQTAGALSWTRLSRSAAFNFIRVDESSVPTKRVLLAVLFGACEAIIGCPILGSCLYCSDEYDYDRIHFF